MSFRLALTAAAAALMIAVAPAQAAVTFNTTASGGTETGAGTFTNKRTYTNSGVTMTATGYYLAAGGTTLAGANVGFYSGAGLGVCDTAEGLSCSSPLHQVDNLGSAGRDFILLQFNAALTIEQILVATFSSNDTDITYYLGNIASNTSLVGATMTSLTSTLGFVAPQTDDGPAGSGASNTLTVGGVTKYNAILVGVPAGQTDDAWKLQSVSVTPSSGGTSPVPEPMSLALLATGLIGLGVASRQRRKA